MRLEALTATKETESRADALVALALSRDTRLSAGALETFEARGFGRYQKAAVDVLTSTDDGVANMFSSAFLGLVERESLIGQISGAITAPLGTAARIQLGSIVATSVDEGVIKLISTLAFSVSRDPKKVSATVIGSVEFFRSFSPEDQAALRRQLVSAAATASDDVLIGALTAGAANGASTPGALLAALGNVKRPVLVGSYLTLVPLAATLKAVMDLGVQVLASPSATGKLIALDAAGLLVASDPIRVDVARHASVLLDDGGSPPVTTTVNLFQENLLALRSEQFAQFSVHPSAVAWATV